MLQIITEKFFRLGERYVTRHCATLYTNYEADRGEKIETVVGSLLPSTGLPSPKTFTCEIIEKQEKCIDGRPGIFVATLGDDLMNDFAAVVSCFFNVTCTPDIDLARRLLSVERHSLGVEAVPSEFVPRMFDKVVRPDAQAAQEFARFVEELVGLERKSFAGAMRAIRQFVTGCHRISDDLSLAYTLFVTSLESLAQAFDGHVATWKDYDQTKRNKIDSALADATEDVRRKVREAVLANEHVAAARRFRDFVLANIAPTYFRGEAALTERPITRPDLPIALRQAYTIRSGYVHTLRELPATLAMKGYAETAEVDDNVALTFAGLARLTRHVILQFVKHGKKVEKEAFEYRLSLPGIVQVKLASHYWISNVEGFDYKTARLHLEAFLEQVAAVLLRQKDAKLTDLRPILAEVERTVHGLKKPSQRRPMLVLYFLFNHLAPEEATCDKWQQLIERYASDFDELAVENVIAHLVSGSPMQWNLEEITRLHGEYFQTRHTAAIVSIGQFWEAALSLHVAEQWRAAGDADRAIELIAFAADAYPSHASLREFAEASTSETLTDAIDWKQILLPPKPVQADPAVSS